MTDAYNYFARQSIGILHGHRAKNLRYYSMTVNERLKRYRETAGLSVRQVARALGFEGHSRYAYYESKRFTDQTIPVGLARELAKIFYPYVSTGDVLGLAGLDQHDRVAEMINLEQSVSRHGGQEVRLSVMLPSETALTRMFEGLLEACGRPDLADELAEKLAQHLPGALEVTPAGHFEESVSQRIVRAEPAQSPARSSRE